MRVLIIEDEPGVAKNLCGLLKEIDSGIEILCILESVRDSIMWLENNPAPDLGFFDIRLSDGESFRIFEETRLDFPVIFTTAYDEYAIRAFKVNSIDYLLKPIDKEELTHSLDKFKRFYTPHVLPSQEMLRDVLKELKGSKQRKYQQNFLVHVRDQIRPVTVESIAFFYLEHGIVYCMTGNKERYALDQSLDKLCEQLDPEQFFRANRQCIVSRKSVISAAQHFNRRLKVSLYPSSDIEVIISKPRVSEFKAWLERG